MEKFIQKFYFPNWELGNKYLSIILLIASHIWFNSFFIFSLIPLIYEILKEFFLSSLFSKLSKNFQLVLISEIIFLYLEHKIFLSSFVNLAQNLQIHKPYYFKISLII